MKDDGVDSIYYQSHKASKRHDHLHTHGTPRQLLQPAFNIFLNGRLDCTLLGCGYILALLFSTGCAEAAIIVHGTLKRIAFPSENYGLVSMCS